jgi:hypothetical protein
MFMASSIGLTLQSFFKQETQFHETLTNLMPMEPISHLHGRAPIAKELCKILRLQIFEEKNL